MLEHVTYHQLGRVLSEAKSGPLFLPLANIPAGSRLLESQCELAFDGPTEDLEVHVLFADVDTEEGPLPDAPLATGETYRQAGGPGRLAWTSKVPDLPERPGVLGIALATGDLPVGTRLGGMLSYVRGRL